MVRVTEELKTVGGGLPRVITTLDEVELRWAGLPASRELASFADRP